jgi:hypothetical protein
LVLTEIDLSRSALTDLRCLAAANPWRFQENAMSLGTEYVHVIHERGSERLLARERNFLKPRAHVTSALAVFLISVVVLGVFTALWGPSRKFHRHDDPEDYMSLGQSLASGNGYKNPVGFWPEAPDYSRMPGWPAIISLGIRMAPGVPPEAVSRFTDAVCLSLAGAFFCVLCGLLGIAPKLSAVAGLAVSLSPSLVALSVDGMSEVSFVMIIAIGLTAIFADRRWLLPGALILGTASLVRANFILVPPLFLILAFLMRSSRAELLSRAKPIHALLACALATAPVLLWTIRNAAVTGRFPYPCSGEGQLMYGGNNEIVANSLEDWGYWVMPELVPGEKTKVTLARELGSDLALDDYYHRKATDWIRHNLSAMPRLELGKFVRAFVPIPWVPRPASYAVFFCRFLLYAFWIGLLPYWWTHMNRAYLLFFLAMAITQIITTAMYYGIFRFTHCYVEVLFIPCIALGLQQWNAQRVRRAMPRAVESV